MNLYDKNGREIEVGDVVKVFHFIGRRRKRHYMYKQVVGERPIGANPINYLVFSHLNFKPANAPDGGYYQALDGRHLADYEIVQSIDAKFEDRPRHTPA